MNRLLVLVGVVSLVSACIEVESPQPLPDYAVFCVLSPGDSLLIATLSRVVPVGERYRLDSTVALPDAVVTLAEGNRVVRLRYNARNFRYEIRNEGFVQPQRTYRLAAEIKNQAPLRASCRVPSDGLAFTTTGEFSGEDYVFSVTWTDLPGEENFYFLTGEVQGNVPMRVPIGNGLTGISPLMVAWGTGFNPRVFTTDKNRDGQRFYSPEGIVRRAANATDSVLLSIRLENRSPEYFEYSQKILDQPMGEDGLISRFKEPALVPSNVENGLGLFGAFSRKTIRVRLK